jgi:site-specific recombinase XerD
VHPLRHTFATHLLEDGLDILTVKDLLCHTRIETTMEYLHVARSNPRRAFSPLDTLFEQCTPKKK